MYLFDWHAVFVMQDKYLLPSVCELQLLSANNLQNKPFFVLQKAKKPSDPSAGAKPNHQEIVVSVSGLLQNLDGASFCLNSSALGFSVPCQKTLILAPFNCRFGKEYYAHFINFFINDFINDAVFRVQRKWMFQLTRWAGWNHCTLAWRFFSDLTSSVNKTSKYFIV